MKPLPILIRSIRKEYLIGEVEMMFSKTYRPVLNLPKTTVERIWDIVGGLFFIGSIIYIIMKWKTLPSEIPAHFNGAGEVDRYGSKFELLILPVIGLLLWIFLDFIERKPHVHNYPARLNESNVEAFYLSSRRMLNVLKNVFLLLFAFISFQTVRIALGEATSLGVWFLPIVLFGTFVPIIVGIRKQKGIE
jgi:uncharacterized membrane protein